MVTINNLNFEGSWPLGTTFSDVPGVYVIYTDQAWLDVGETDKFGSRINGDNHERKPQWIQNSDNFQIKIAFLNISNGQRRLEVESQLRTSLRPLCGIR